MTEQDEQRAEIIQWRDSDFISCLIASSFSSSFCFWRLKSGLPLFLTGPIRYQTLLNLNLNPAVCPWRVTGPWSQRYFKKRPVRERRIEMEERLLEMEERGLMERLEWQKERITMEREIEMLRRRLRWVVNIQQTGTSLIGWNYVPSGLFCVSLMHTPSNKEFFLILWKGFIVIDDWNENIFAK